MCVYEGWYFTGPVGRLKYHAQKTPIVSQRNASSVSSTYLRTDEPTIPISTMSRLSLLIALLVFASACTSDDAKNGTAEGTDGATNGANDGSTAETIADLRSPSAEDARIFFVGMEDGATVSSPFMVEFGLENMTVAPAGTDEPFSGHHHLLINQEELPALEMPIPADSVHIHFGLGQTSTELSLPAGEHTLQIMLGNHWHIPHDPPVVSEKVTITVQ